MSDLQSILSNHKQELVRQQAELASLKAELEASKQLGAGSERKTRIAVAASSVVTASLVVAIMLVLGPPSSKGEGSSHDNDLASRLAAIEGQQSELTAKFGTMNTMRTNPLPEASKDELLG